MCIFVVFCVQLVSKRMTKMSADGKPAHSCTRILTDSARKRNRKAALVNCNKTRMDGLFTLKLND
jgi:hypothetical protein